jgi:hypothetical protein
MKIMSAIEIFLAALCICAASITTVQRGMESERPLRVAEDESSRKRRKVQKKSVTSMTKFNVILDRNRRDPSIYSFELSCCPLTATLADTFKALYKAREYEIKRTEGDILTSLPITLQGYFQYGDKKIDNDNELREVILQSNESGTPIVFDPDLQNTANANVKTLSSKAHAILCLGVSTTPQDIIRAFRKKIKSFSEESGEFAVISCGEALLDKPLGIEGIKSLKDAGAIFIAKKGSKTMQGPHNFFQFMYAVYIWFQFMLLHHFI